MLQTTRDTPAAERIRKARTALLLDHPFFGSLLFRLKSEECRAIPTMATNGVVLCYNSAFVDTLNAATLAGVLAHEVMHPALQHHTRRAKRDPRRWNEACDYAINPLLLDAGLSLPEDVLVDSRFRGMSAEQIYNLREAEAQPQSDDQSESEQNSGSESSDSAGGENDSGTPSVPESQGGIGQVSPGAVLPRYQGRVVAELAEWMKCFVSKSKALPPLERASLGLVLAGVGDSRVGVGLSNDLPSLDWCRIPSGTQTLGLSPSTIAIVRDAPWARGWAYDRELSRGAVLVEEFEISRYAVTIDQFLAFVNDGGYAEERYWNLEGWEWLRKTELHEPGEQKWGSEKTLPVTNVSWYECSAFCNWLSEQLHADIHLPSAAQWERASRGDDGRIFPWGNSFDPTRANCRETGIGRVNVVGVFPSDDGPWGPETPLEMAGNVWEWCKDDEADSGQISHSGFALATARATSGNRVSKGGAYLSAPFYLKCTYLGRDFPWARYSRQGFRVAKSLQKKEPEIK